MTIAELIKALDGLDPSTQVVIRDTSWNGVLYIDGVYENELSGVVEIEAEDTDNAQQSFQLTVCEFVIFELWRDNLQFINPIYQMVLDEFHHELEKGTIPNLQTFIHHPNPAISQVAIQIASFSETVSYKWEKLGVSVPQEIHLIKKGIEHQLFSLKEKRLNQILKDAKQLIKTADPFENKNVFEFVILLENQKNVSIKY